MPRKQKWHRRAHCRASFEPLRRKQAATGSEGSSTLMRVLCGCAAVASNMANGSDVSIFCRQNFSQKWRSPTHWVFRDSFWSAGDNNFTTGIARFRTDIHDIIGFRNHAEVVLDDDDSMAVVH